MVRTWSRSMPAETGTAERLEAEMDRHLAGAEKLGRAIGEHWFDLIERHAQRSAA